MIFAEYDPCMWRGQGPCRQRYIEQKQIISLANETKNSIMILQNRKQPGKMHTSSGFTNVY